MTKKKKSKETVHYDKLMKAKVKIINQFYPKPPATIEEGSFGIVTAKIVEWDNTSAEPILHPTYQTITIKGNRLPKIVMNEEYIVHGYETSSEYGISYTVAMMSELVDLSTPEKQRAFLSELITPKQLESLFNTFENPYEVIKTGDLDQLTQVNGIGRKTAEKLLRKIMGAHDLALIYSELADYQLTQREIEHLIYHFKNPKLVVEAMRENPFVLMRVVSRVGFQRCDEMAMRAGISPDSPYRVAGFIQHYLEQQADEGNSWITTDSLLQAIDEAFVKTPISNQALSKGLKMMAHHLMWHNEDKTKVALKQVLILEEAIALELTRLLTAENTFEFEDWEQKLKEQEERQGWTYTDEQRQGIQMLLENNVSILQGYAGCVDKDTEYFNGTEWKKISDYVEGESVLQFNPDDRTGELVKPIRYIKHPQQTLYHFKTKYGLDQCLSLDHNVLYETSKGGLKTIPFEEVIERHKNCKGGFTGKFLTTFDYSGKGIDLTDEEIRVMCAVICDGTFIKNNHSNWCIINLKKERKKERLIQLLVEAGIEFKVVEKGNGYHRFGFYAPSREKEFESYWYQCTQEQLKVITSEILKWDGSEDGTRRRFSTTSKKTADFIQFAYSATGERASLSINDRRGQTYQTNGKEYIRKSVEYSLQITHSNKPKIGGFHDESKKTQITPYQTLDGYQYCFTMPSGYLVLRRNGKIFVTGNSGKSSCVAGMLAVFDGKYKTSACALSGKAAVNISEVASVNGTQIEGKTIHRLLKVRGEEGEFAHGKFNPLPDQVIILDEVSMVGGELFLSLLQAIPTGAKLIMLGDLGQLESIGRCNIMYDMVESNIIPNIFLTKIHRQASKSAIVTDSITVRQGKHLCKASDEKEEIRGELQDLTLDVYQDKSKTLTKVINHFKKEWAEMDNIMDIMVLMPMRDRGEACVYKANNEIQKIVQPNTMFKPYYTINEGAKNEFRVYVGDKVLNNKNDYNVFTKNGEETAIFNGNLGIVTEINGANHTLTVDFEMIGEVVLNRDQMKYLTLGYAMTVHKCIHPDTQLFTSVGIKSLRDYDLGTPLYESRPIKAVASVYNGSFMEKPSSYYNAGKTKCKQIITEAGYDLIATMDHRLDVLDTDGYIWTKPVSDIKEGDVLLISRRNRHFGRRRQELFVKFHGDSEPDFKLQKYLHKDEVLALTLLLNYGFIEEKEITLTLPNEELVSVVERGLDKGFNVKPIIQPIEEAGTVHYDLTIQSYKLCELIRQLYRKETFDYFFPQILMGFDEDITRQMLQLLFEEVIYDETNQALILQCRTEKMADQIRMMLLNFGIISNKKEVAGEFDLHLTHHNLLLFKDEIGCYLEESNEQLNQFCETVEDKRDQEKGYGLFHIANDLIANHRLGCHPLEQGTLTELTQFIHQFEETLKGNMKFDYLKEIVLNYYPDPIRTMNDLTTYTYCIEMPLTHRFIQNGIRGWNCVTGETHLFTNQGIKQLKELDNGAKPYEAKPYEGEIKVFNGEGMEKPSHFYNAGESETRIVKTKTGYEIEGTLDHRAYVLAEDGNLQVKTFGELTTDDYLFISSGMEVYGDEVELPKEWFNIKTKSTGLSYQLPQKMTKALALFLGLVVADGSLSTKSIQLTKRHLEVVTQFKALTEQLFGYTTGVIKENKNEETGEITHYSYTIHSSFITAFVKQFDGVSPHNKFVPTCILKAPKEYQVEFLKGVFEDGSVNIKNNRFEHIELTMKSKKMSEQIQMMLLNMGILVSKGWYGGTFRLTIYSNHAMTFKRLIGFISSNKQERLNTYLTEEQIKHSKLTIPYIYQLVDNLYQRHHLTNQRNLDPTIKKKIAKMRMRKTITQQTLKEILEAIEPFIEDDKGMMTYLKWVSTMRIEPIKSITQSRNQTYCLTMPDTHRFVQNGLLLLNCQGMGVKKVIIGIDYGSYALLTKEMIYTAITRAKQKCILVAETKALRFAIGRSNLKKKQTFLQQLLKDLNKK